MTLEQSAQTRDKKTIRLLGLGTAISLLGDATLYVALPDPSYASVVGLSLAQVSILLGVNRFARIFLNGPVGWLYDKASRRSILLAAAFIAVLSTAMYATVTGFIPFLIARILWAIAWSGIWIGGNTIVLSMANDQDRGRLISAYQIWFFLGAAISAMMGGILTNFFGFRIGLLVSSVLTLIGALMWVIWLPKKGNQGPRSRAVTKPGRLPWMLIIKISVPVFIARLLLHGVANSTTILWLNDLFSGSVELASFSIPIVVMSGYVMASRGLVGMGNSLLLGKIADKLGHLWIMIAAASVIGAIGFYLMAGSQPAAALAGTLILGAALATVTILYPVLAGQGSHTEQHGRVLGNIGILGDLGSALGPVLALNALAVVSLSKVYQASSILLLLLAGFATAMGIGAIRSKRLSESMVDEWSRGEQERV